MTFSRMDLQHPRRLRQGGEWHHCVERRAVRRREERDEDARGSEDGCDSRSPKPPRLGAAGRKWSGVRRFVAGQAQHMVVEDVRYPSGEERRPEDIGEEMGARGHASHAQEPSREKTR